MIIRPKWIAWLKPLCVTSLSAIVMAGVNAAPAQQEVNHSAAQASSRPSAQPTLVIAYAAHLKNAADQWAAYRAQPAGGQWRIVPISFAQFSKQEKLQQRESLQHLIRDAYREARPSNPRDFAVLLLGDADESGIPTWTFPQTDPSLQSNDEKDFISDHPYQLLDDRDSAPDVALGRVPAQTNEEALAVLHKIQSYEAAGASSQPFDGGRNRITYVAGEGHFGVMDNLFESLFKTMVDRMVPDAFELSMTYAKPSSVYCPPPSQVTDTVLKRLSEGSLLFNYVGHGHATGVDSLYWNNKRFPILRANDLQREPTPPTGAQLPVAFMSCCSVGHFDLPKGQHSLAEEMLFHPSGGAVAVIAGSRITHPYANTILQMDITKALLVDRAPTVGMLDLMAEQSLVRIDDVDRELDAIALPIALAGKWQTTLMDLRKMHVKLYNLLGDPATRLPLPPQSISNLKFENSRVTGSIPGMKSGTITITAETSRPSFAHPEKLDPVTGDNDSDLEKKTANNYPLANDRVLSRFEATVKNGEFTVALPDSLPTAAAVLRAYAAGTNERGERIDAIGALRLAPATTQPHGAER